MRKKPRCTTVIDLKDLQCKWPGNENFKTPEFILPKEFGKSRKWQLLVSDSWINETGQVCFTGQLVRPRRCDVCNREVCKCQR